MKLKYFGTAAYEGVPSLFCQCESCKRALALGGKNMRTRAQALIDDAILLDFNADTVAHYQTYKFDWTKIKYCLITHSHSDHFYPADIAMFVGQGYTHDVTHIDFYGAKSVYDQLEAIINDKDWWVDPARMSAFEVKPGELFGMDDAVFITSKAITSVDVSLVNVYNGKRVVHLKDIKRVRLSAPRRLSPELQKALESRMNRTGLKYQPQVFENGWYCACGAFHPKEEDTVYCSECGCDRILLQNALNTLLQPEQPAQTEPELETPLAPQPEQEEPTRIMGAAPVQPAQEEPTRIMGAPRRPQPQEPAAEPTRMLDDGMREQFPDRAARAQAEEGTRVMPAASRRAQSAAQQPEPDYEDNEEYEDERDSVAETLIRWVPPITAVICAAVALCGFVYYQFVL